MATSYAAIERELLRQARKEADAYAAAQRKKADAALRQFIADGEAEYNTKKEAYFRQAKDAVAEPVPARRTAAVLAALTRRQVREKMADRGLSGSGPEAAGLSGAAAAKAAAETEAALSAQKALSRIQSAIGQEYRRMREKQVKKRRALSLSTEQDIQKHRASLEKSAYSRAASIARSDKALALWEKGNG